MTQRTIRGLTFEVGSPSVWELVGYPVFVVYEDLRWRVYLVNPDPARTTERDFATFNECIELLVLALDHRQAS